MSITTDYGRVLQQPWLEPPASTARRETRLSQGEPVQYVGSRDAHASARRDRTADEPVARAHVDSMPPTAQQRPDPLPTVPVRLLVTPSDSHEPSSRLWLPSATRREDDAVGVTAGQQSPRFQRASEVGGRSSVGNCTGDRESVRRQYPLPTGSQSFSVFCGPFETDDERAMVESIVTSGKPAHVGADVVELDTGLRLAGDTFLGINSRLTTREFLLGETTLGEETVLVDRSEPT